MEFKCFREVVIEPDASCEFLLILEEMKKSSVFMGMPVSAKFYGRELRITSDTDIEHTMYCFFHKIDTDNVKTAKAK